MSASREKKARQERGADYLSPKQQKANEEQRANRRATVLFAVCAAVVVVGVIAALLVNDGVFARRAAAASVNGKTYTASDMAYYYYNGRSNLLNANSSLSSSASLRDQEYTAGDEYDTWYDYLSNEALRTLALTERTVQAAKDAGYDGGSAVDEAVENVMSSMQTSAAGSGYSLGGYVKALFGGLMTRSSFERSLRAAALADAYTVEKSSVSNYSDAELTAEAEADPAAYAMVDYEYAIYSSADYAVDADEESGTEADDGSAGARAAAESALARYRAGESLESIVFEAQAAYASGTAYYGDSELAAWLFDDARRDGDATVLDYAYYGISMGAMTVVFHSRELADFHTVDVRHILVDDEETANDVLAHYLAGAQTEDAFAALAREYSSDNADDGGLYENVYIGQMVQSFNDWCFDASRQPGDTGIVETSYGYHVMYFVGRSDYAYWQQLVAAKLASDWQNSLTDGVSTELLGGMKYIDP